MLNRLLRHHLAHIRSAGWISNHSGSAAKKSNGTVPRHLQTLHQAERHEVAYMKAVCSGIKADVKSGFPLVYHFFDFFFVCYLGDQPSGFQFFPNCHFISSCVSLNSFLFYEKSPVPVRLGREPGPVLPPKFTEKNSPPH